MQLHEAKVVNFHAREGNSAQCFHIAAAGHVRKACY
jgi:hypothetical protein